MKIPPKEKAFQLVKAAYELICERNNFNGVKKGNEKTFYAIENAAKQVICKLIDEEMADCTDLELHEYWQCVKSEIENL